MIYIFTLSIISLIVMQSRHSIELCCWLYQYTFYVFIYTAIPYIYVFYPNEIVNVSLLNLNKSTVSKLVDFSTFTNITILIFLFMMRDTKRKVLLRPPETIITSNLPTLLFYALIPVSILMSVAYPWGDFGDVRTFGHSLASYLKFIVSLLFILQAAVFRHTKRHAWIFKFSLLLMLILFTVDTARTTFFVSLIAASYAYRFTFRSARKYFIVLLICFFLFMYITLSRTGIEFRFEYLLWPFFAEGIFGSYSALNALNIDSHIGFNVWSALSFFVDQFMLILPSFVVDLSGYHFSFVRVLNEANDAGWINGKLSPLGGFFAFADMILAFSWLGVVIFPIFLFAYLSLIKKTTDKIGLYLYICFFIFLKSPLFVILNMIISVCIILLIYKALITILPKIKRVVDGI